MAYIFYAEYATYFIRVIKYSCHSLIKFDNPITFNSYNTSIYLYLSIQFFVLPKTTV